MVDRQRPQDDVLGEVGVLVLVDQDVAEARVELGAHLGVLVQQLATCSSRSSKSTAPTRRAAAADRPGRPAATTWLSGLPTRGSYLSAVISLFLAALIAAAMRSGV